MRRHLGEAGKRVRLAVMRTFLRRALQPEQPFQDVSLDHAHDGPDSLQRSSTLGDKAATTIDGDGFVRNNRRPAGKLVRHDHGDSTRKALRHPSLNTYPKVVVSTGSRYLRPTSAWLSALLHESPDLATNPYAPPSAGGCDETESSAAKRLERDWIFDVRPVRRNDGQFLIEQYDLLIPSDSAIKSAEALRRISRRNGSATA